MSNSTLEKYIMSNINNDAEFARRYRTQKQAAKVRKKIYDTMERPMLTLKQVNSKKQEYKKTVVVKGVTVSRVFRKEECYIAPECFMEMLKNLE